MAIQTINLGNVVNDGLGDDLRTAFEKVNANFTELQSVLTITASNLGVTGEGVFAQKDGADLQFKRILGGTKTRVSSTSTSVVIDNTQPDSFTDLITQSGNVSAANGLSATIQGGNDITTSAVNNTVVVDTILPLDNILNRFDFGPFDGNFQYPTQLALASSNNDFGTISTPGRVDLDLGTIAGG